MAGWLYIAKNISWKNTIPKKRQKCMLKMIANERVSVSEPQYNLLGIYFCYFNNVHITKTISNH